MPGPSGGTPGGLGGGPQGTPKRGPRDPEKGGQNRAKIGGFSTPIWAPGSPGDPGAPRGGGGCTFRRVFNNSPSRDKMGQNSGLNERFYHQKSVKSGRVPGGQHFRAPAGAPGCAPGAPPAHPGRDPQI